MIVDNVGGCNEGNGNRKGNERREYQWNIEETYGKSTMYSNSEWNPTLFDNW